MKRLFTLISILTMFGLGSCKQNWECQCTASDGSVSNTAINGGTFIHAQHTCKGMSGKCSLITEGRQ